MEGIQKLAGELAGPAALTLPPTPPPGAGRAEPIERSCGSRQPHAAHYAHTNHPGLSFHCAGLPALPGPQTLEPLQLVTPESLAQQGESPSVRSGQST